MDPFAIFASWSFADVRVIEWLTAASLGISLGLMRTCFIYSGPRDVRSKPNPSKLLFKVLN